MWVACHADNENRRVAPMTNGPVTTTLADIDVTILCGGMGSRIHSVLPETPKVLAPVNGRPYLDYMASWLVGFGCQRIVLCLGHLAEKVETYLRGRSPGGVVMIPSVEPEPLGTAGAVRHAKALVHSDPVMVMNGDSWVDADLAAFVSSHIRAGASISMLCVKVADISRFGSVDLGPDGTVRGFSEKGGRGEGLINAGVYLFSRRALEELTLSTGPSLERDFLERQTAGTIRAFVQENAAFIDIGTPESLANAGNVLGMMEGKTS